MSVLFRWSCSISVHLPGLSLGRWPCSISLFICLPGLVTDVVRPLSVGHAAFLFICLPGLSLLVSALFRWRCNISVRLSPMSVTGGVRPFPLFLFICLPCLSLLISAPCSISIHLSPGLVTGGVRPFPLFLFICLAGLSLLVSALFRWPCSISIHLSPRSVTGVSLSIGHEAFLFICLPGPSLLVPCSMSIHLSFRSVTGGVRPFPLAMQHFYSFGSRVCHWCCPFPLFLFICLPCLSLLISALFRWPCSISIHLSPGLVTGGARPFPLFLFICLAGLSLVCPCLLAMKHFYSFVSQVRHCWCHVAFLFICLSGHWWCPPFSVGHVAFLFICLPGLSLPVSALFRWPCSISINLPGLSLLVSALVRWPCSISMHVSPRPVTGGVRPLPLAM